ncbi:MAG: hypothetical protein ACLQQ4_06820 [Bacteroidia bacterium]
MKTLKPIGHYMMPKSQSHPSIISLEKFNEDGIELTIDEGIFLGTLEYNGLQGEMPIIDNGIPKYIKVHPFVEACYEFLVGGEKIKKHPEIAKSGAALMGMTLKEFENSCKRNSEIAKSILGKLGMPIASIQADIDRRHGLIN